MNAAVFYRSFLPVDASCMVESFGSNALIPGRYALLILHRVPEPFDLNSQLPQRV
jgi:hypothetical protein